MTRKNAYKTGTKYCYFCGKPVNKKGKKIQRHHIKVGKAVRVHEKCHQKHHNCLPKAVNKEDTPK